MKVVGGGGLGGVDDLRGRRVGPVGDVLAHAAGEQHRVLQDDGDLLAQPLQGAVAGVAAVDQDACRRSGRRSGRRGRTSVDLPAPDGPGQGEALARGRS